MQEKKEDIIQNYFEEGNYYINKKTKETEHEIIRELQTLEHFPKILEFDEDNFIVKMPYYHFIKVNFKENMWFVKNYLKCLLLTIQQLNYKEYYHGDIKPSNYLYLNPEKYVLIDFNASGKIDDKNINQKIGTYPYIPPEVNKFCEIDKKMIKKEIYGTWELFCYFLCQKITKYLKIC